MVVFQLDNYWIITDGGSVNLLSVRLSGDGETFDPGRRHLKPPANVGGFCLCITMIVSDIL